LIGLELLSGSFARELNGLLLHDVGPAIFRPRWSFAVISDLFGIAVMLRVICNAVVM
jgi:hypothetical protein